METTNIGRVVRIMNNNLKNEMMDDGEEDDGEEDDETYGESSSKKKVTGKRGSGSGSIAYCQVDGCTNDMINCKPYHRRHKVCEAHSKAPVVITGGYQQRFCQQCSRFHDIREFDDAKRSCRMRLAGHNERRRKSSHETYGESS